MLGIIEQRFLELPQGGTAVGSGINAHKQFAKYFAQEMTKLSGNKCVPSENFFHELSAQDCSVQLSGELKNLAVILMKISNDLRWMNSGPLAGFSEIELQALQPGSSSRKHDICRPRNNKRRFLFFPEMSTSIAKETFFGMFWCR